MIRVIVSYPTTPGARFNLDYYMKTHMPLVSARCARYGMKGWAVDQGMAGAAPGSPAEFAMQAHLLFESAEAFQAAMAAEGASIMADIPNYTDIQPHIQINQILAEQAPAQGTGA